MNITIEIQYKSPAGNSSSAGDFKVNLVSYRKDEFKEAARIGKMFFDRANHDCGYRAELIKVIYNGKHDVTHLIEEEPNPWDQIK